jgi:hypothetical protein
MTPMLQVIGKVRWSFRGGTRGNAVPIVNKLSGRMGTEFHCCYVEECMGTVIVPCLNI